MNRPDTEAPNIVVDRCELGFGLFAMRNFRAGEFLFSFTGPTIGIAETNAKGDTEGNVLQIGPTSYIDLEPLGVFVNHSCNPNAGIRDSIQVYALREIRSGEEIRIDYSTTISEKRWTLPCRCNADSCRKIIGDFHDLPQTLQNNYLALGIVQPFIVAEMRNPPLDL